MENESVVAFQFIFEAKKMKELLDTDPVKVVCTVSIDSEVTKEGKKVGALRIVATGTYPPDQLKTLKTLEIVGCPKPPCSNE